jgi:two-component system, response regulator
VNNKYVLLVEDNPDDVTLTEIAFKKGKIPNKLVVAVDGQEALDLLFCRGKYDGQDTCEKPALVLLDLKLPLVSGLDVLKAIRANSRTHQIPVVILTSSMEDTDKTESCNLGADDFIRKPTGFSNFVEIIQQVKVKWLS